MYELAILEDGNFEVYNTKRKKTVYKGRSPELSEPKLLEFKAREDLIRYLSGTLSIKNFRKVNKILTPDNAI